MTKEEFESIGWNKNCIVFDDYGHKGHVLSVNLEYGVIHYDDDVKKCSFGRRYNEVHVFKADKITPKPNQYAENES